jgi:hypothetical protein
MRRFGIALAGLATLLAGGACATREAGAGSDTTNASPIYGVTIPAGRFVDGKPVDEAQHQTCFACHEARVQGHDYVFTRLAP